MDERGELEVRINTRMVERAVFAIIIIVLAVLYFTKGGADTSSLKASVATLSQQLSDKTSQLEQLQNQLNSTQNATNSTKPQIIVTATPPVVTQNTTVPPVENLCNGKVNFSWNVQGTMQGPLQYNAAQISSLEDQINNLSAQINATNNSNVRTSLQLQLDNSDLTSGPLGLRQQLANLKKQPTKYTAANVTLTVFNGKDSPVAYSYLMCWLFTDCSVVYTEANLNMQACSNQTVNVDFGNVPHTVTVAQGSSQSLRMMVSDANDTVVFKDDKSFSSAFS